MKTSIEQGRGGGGGGEGGRASNWPEEERTGESPFVRTAKGEDCCMVSLGDPVS